MDFPDVICHIVKGLSDLTRLQVRLQELIAKNTLQISPHFWEGRDHLVITVSVSQAPLQPQSLQHSCSDFPFLITNMETDLRTEDIILFFCYMISK